MSEIPHSPIEIREQIIDDIQWKFNSNQMRAGHSLRCHMELWRSAPNAQ